MPSLRPFKVTTYSPDETKKLASKLASLLSGGDVLSLTGDLGAGKTCFVQGLAKGLGVRKRITSPTFNLIKEYPSDPPFYHFDVYRLKSAADLLDLGYEEYFFSDGVTAIEWGDKVKRLLPPSYLEIRFKRSLEENVRDMEVIPINNRWKEIVERWLGER